MRIANTQGIKNIVANGGPKAISKGNLPKKGEVIEGKIINSNRDMVEVLLNNGQKLKASLKGSRFFNIGDNVKFIVKSSDLSQLILKGVSNNSMEDKFIKVLENGGERPNERNIDIVKSLFDEGMAVNKENVSKFIKLGLKFKALTPKMLISFEKLGIPFTKENTDIVAKFISGEKPFVKDFDNFLNTLLGKDDFKENSDLLMKEEQNKLKEADLKQASMLKISEENSSVKNTNTKGTLIKTIRAFLGNSGDKDLDITKLSLSKLFKKEDFTNLVNKLSLVDKSNPKVLENELKDIFAKDSSLEKLIELFDKKGMNKEASFKILKEVFTNTKIEDKLYVKAEEFSKEELKESIKNTINLAEKSAEISEEIKDKATKLTETIKLMDKLSEEYNFIHFPIMLNEKNGNAEIYLKKQSNRISKKDTLKALLKLDFANMGHLDILIGKEDKNISLVFYSEDKLEDLKENLKILRNDLNKAGFSLLDCDFKNEIGERNMQEFFSMEKIEEEKPAVSFDMRA